MWQRMKQNWSVFKENVSDLTWKEAFFGDHSFALKFNYWCYCGGTHLTIWGFVLSGFAIIIVIKAIVLL